jgi:ubiquinone/menaquinone biosynthesis C-methylase UbiE
VTLGQRFARLVTGVAVRTPRAWRLLRPLVRRQFDALAPRWESFRMPDSLASYEAALEALPVAPAHALDLGTGTGAGAVAIARRFPEAHVVGADISSAMLAEARRGLPEELRSRVGFQEADASELPFADASFALVAHQNMIPFFDEVARVLAPGGHALFAFSSGATTPIYVPPERLRSELSARGFAEFAGFNVGRGNALLARKSDAA